MKVSPARSRGAVAVLGIAGVFLVAARLAMAQDTVSRTAGHATTSRPPVEVTDGAREPVDRRCDRVETGWVAVDTSADGLIETAINAKCARGPGPTFDFPVRFRVIRGSHTGQRHEQTWRVACQLAGGQFQMVGVAVAWDEYGKEVKHASNDDLPERWRRPRATDRGGWQALQWACDHVNPRRGP